jgi:hypothetical protein
LRLGGAKISEKDEVAQKARHELAAIREMIAKRERAVRDENHPATVSPEAKLGVVVVDPAAGWISLTNWMQQAFMAMEVSNSDLS